MQFTKRTSKLILSHPQYRCTPKQVVNTQGDSGATGPIGYSIGYTGPTGPQGNTGPQGPSENYPPFINYTQMYNPITVQPNASYTVPMNTSTLQPGTYMVVFYTSISTSPEFTLTDVSIQYSGFNANYTSTKQFLPVICSDLYEQSTHLFTNPGTPVITISTTTNPIQLDMSIQFILMKSS